MHADCWKSSCPTSTFIIGLCLTAPWIFCLLNHLFVRCCHRLWMHNWFSTYVCVLWISFTMSTSILIGLCLPALLDILDYRVLHPPRMHQCCSSRYGTFFVTLIMVFIDLENINAHRTNYPSLLQYANEPMHLISSHTKFILSHYLCTVDYRVLCLISALWIIVCFTQECINVVLHVLARFLSLVMHDLLSIWKNINADSKQYPTPAICNEPMHFDIVTYEVHPAFVLRTILTV